MDHKALKKLADACRKAGIKHFKNSEVEFTLSDEGPVSNYKKRTSAQPSSQLIETTDSIFQSDQLTEEQLLLWSTPGDEGTQ